MKTILTVSDEVDPQVYSPAIKQRFGHVDLVISCGDLPYDYLDYIISSLNCPLYFVHGNHDLFGNTDEVNYDSYPLGGENLHGRVLRKKDLILAGVEGSILYNQRSPYQYSQGRFWSLVLGLVPGLLLNKLRYGRYLDIFVTHAPPKAIHDRSDWAHRGINAFRWLIKTFQPGFHFHGHIHLYRPDEVWETALGRTQVINTFRSRVIQVPGAK